MTQAASISNCPITIPSLSWFVFQNLPDRTYTQYYVDWTKDLVFRRGRKRLFISHVDGFQWEIRPATVTRWIVSTIRSDFEFKH
jgi:hypothetical protein